MKEEGSLVLEDILFGVVFGVHQHVGEKEKPPHFFPLDRFAARYGTLAQVPFHQKEAVPCQEWLFVGLCRVSIADCGRGGEFCAGLGV